MAKTISPSRAARLVGVKRGALQQQIRAGDLSRNGRLIDRYQSFTENLHAEFDKLSKESEPLTIPG